MKKKVDLAALVGGAPKNDMKGRAPLAPGFEEDTPVATSTEVAVPTPPAPEVGAPADRDEGSMRDMADKDNLDFDAAKIDAATETLVTVDEAGKPSGVLVPTPPVPQPTVEDQTEVQILRAALAALTKRLEDFGAIPLEAPTGPRVPVVTVTKAGNVRTDW